MMTRGKPLLILGAVLIVFSTVFTTVLPSISYQVVSANSPDGQDALLAVSFVSNLMGTILPAMGSAFLGAGLVLLHLERRHSDER